MKILFIIKSQGTTEYTDPVDYSEYESKDKILDQYKKISFKFRDPDDTQYEDIVYVLKDGTEYILKKEKDQILIKTIASNVLKILWKTTKVYKILDESNYDDYDCIIKLIRQ